MQVYISNREIEEIAEGLVRTVYGQNLPKQIDLGLLSKYLGVTVLYEKIAEDDLDKIGFVSDGCTPLMVCQKGVKCKIIYPKDTVVLDIFLLRPEEYHRKRFTEGHEIGHILLNRADPMRNAACFNRVYDTERSYSITELHDRMSLDENQANAMAACLLMPRALLTDSVKRHFRRKTIPVYGNCVFLPQVKPILQKMSKEIGVSHTALFIQLRKYGLLEQRNMSEYFQKTGRNGEISDEYR